MQQTVVVFTRNNARVLTGLQLEEIDKFKSWANAIIDPDLSLVHGIPPHLWNIYDGLIIPLTKDEQINRLKDINKNGLDNEIALVKPHLKRTLLPSDFIHYLAYLIIIALLILRGIGK